MRYILEKIDQAFLEVIGQHTIEIMEVLQDLRSHINKGKASKRKMEIAKKELRHNAEGILLLIEAIS